MRKAIIIASIAALVCFDIGVSAFAAEKEAAKPAAPTARPMKALPPMLSRANFSMLYGTVTRIDVADPANVKLEVKNDADNTTHIVDVVPATSVTKATTVSELKTGENVRVMARKVDSKEVAMNVMFGNIRKPAPRPAIPAGATPPPTAAPKAQK